MGLFGRTRGIGLVLAMGSVGVCDWSERILVFFVIASRFLRGGGRVRREHDWTAESGAGAQGTHSADDATVEGLLGHYEEFEY